jgi:hypothetical protein
VTRQIRALVLIIALALVAGISSYLTTVNDRDAPDPRPLPTLVADLPAANARQAFADRVRHRFPIGSPERTLMLELWSEGFAHPGDATKQWASLDRRGPPCTRNWTVTWTTDGTGQLTAIDGTYIPSC